jgi:hypothetical protein
MKTNIEKIINAIKDNKPILIKNFINKNTYKTEINNLLHELKNDKKIQLNPNKDNFLFKNFFYRDLKNYNFYTDINKSLSDNNFLECSTESRIWMHKKNNLTKYHYDGNGINVINICLNGKKKFLLTKPNTQITLPFTNMSLMNTQNKVEEFIVEKYDLFLIPQFWFHEVLTMEENTVTLNVRIINKKCKIDNNNLMKYKLHNLFNTDMINEGIMNVANKQKISLINFCKHYFIESLLIILLITLCFIIQKTVNININGIVIIIISILTFLKGKESVGMLNIFSYNYIIQYLIIKKITTANKLFF